MRSMQHASLIMHARWSAATASASNSSVKRPCGAAQASLITLTPHLGQRHHGGSPRSTVANCMVSSCRHSRPGARPSQMRMTTLQATQSSSTQCTPPALSELQQLSVMLFQSHARAWSGSRSLATAP